MSIIGDGATYLDALDQADREALFAVGRRRLYPRSHTLMRQGEPGRFTVAILRGWVSVSLNGANGGRVVLALRGGGDLVGDLAVLDGKPRSATVTTLDDVECYVIPAKAFRTFLSERPHAAALALHCVGSRLRDSDGLRMSLATAPVIQRLAAYLGELTAHTGVPTGLGMALDLRIPQQELAAAVGATREAVAKALRVLRDRGVIRTAPPPLVVLDLAALQAISAGRPSAPGRRAA